MFVTYRIVAAQLGVSEPALVKVKNQSLGSMVGDKKILPMNETP